MRNIKKQAEQGCNYIQKKYPNSDMTVRELLTLIEPCRTGDIKALYDSISDAFYMGIAIGVKHSK